MTYEDFKRTMGKTRTAGEIIALTRFSAKNPTKYRLYMAQYRQEKERARYAANKAKKRGMKK